MEQLMLWIAIIGTIALPIIGWIFNSLITNKIDEINKDIEFMRVDFEAKIEQNNKSAHEYKGLIFTKIDLHRVEVERTYVRIDINNEKLHNLEEKTDSKLTANMLLLQQEFKYVKEALDKLTLYIENKK